MGVNAAAKPLTVIGDISGSGFLSIRGDITGSGNISGSAASTGSFGRVEASTITGTLQTAAQTNITSLCTITTFRSTGIDDNANALAITINSDEYVGIGTTNPTRARDVVGDIKASGDIIAERFVVS